MKKHLLREFILTYLIIGVIGFLSLTVTGSYLIEKYLINVIARSLNLEADSISENQHLLASLKARDWDILTEDLKTISNYEDSYIWILDENNEIVVAVPEVTVDSVSDLFEPETWGEDDYSIGNFYDIFPDSRLTVVSPIYIEGAETPSYIVIHYQMERLYIRRSSALRISQVLFILMYILASVMPFLYYFRVHRQLQNITHGITEYTNGNLAYRIPIKSNNEMAYLGNALNYMSDILNQNSQYQRQFVSNISHDFRSPLTSIKGYVNAILDGTIPPENQEHYLQIIASEADRLEKLTKSLQTLNELDIKKRTINRTHFDINQTVLTSAAVFEGTYAGKDIHLDLDLSEGELLVNADVEQIQQVISNLLDNAIKFSPEHSSIKIETKRKGGRVFVSITDQGCGISKENLPKIWTRFYKADMSRGKDRKGSGLGLAIVKEIINAHGQQIDVISTEGVGTEFIFTLEKA